MKETVAIARCPAYIKEDVDSAVRKAVGDIGGIRNFIKPNQRFS